MAASETTKIVMSRIESADPENGWKIMAYILNEDLGEKMNWLASASDFRLRMYIALVKALIELHSRPDSPTPINNGSAVTFNGLIPTPPPFQGWPVNNAAGNMFGADSFLNYQQQREELLPFMANGMSDSMPVDSPQSMLRRSLFEEGGDGNGNGNGFLRKPCMYFAKGFCRNGSNCKFLHIGSDAVDGGGVSGFDESMKQKSFSYNEIISINRSDSSSRQIYLTFPADSTFKEEDVCDYFKMFGPVQDVRIPYQEPRMFGFVLFDSAETVKNVLAKGNPHFVCDSKVLVKPYKEKTKVQEKKYQHLLDREEYSSSSSHPLIDSREHFELPFGPRMILNHQDMIQDSELQHIRILSLQPRNHARNHFLQGFPSSIPGFPSNISYSQLLNQRSFMDQRMSDLCDAITENSQDFNDDSDESMTQFLPSNLFASPTKSVADNQSTLSK